DAAARGPLGEPHRRDGLARARDRRDIDRALAIYEARDVHAERAEANQPQIGVDPAERLRDHTRRALLGPRERVARDLQWPGAGEEDLALGAHLEEHGAGQLSPQLELQHVARAEDVG